MPLGTRVGIHILGDDLWKSSDLLKLHRTVLEHPIWPRRPLPGAPAATFPSSSASGFLCWASEMWRQSPPVISSLERTLRSPHRPAWALALGVSKLGSLQVRMECASLVLSHSPRWLWASLSERLPPVQTGCSSGSEIKDTSVWG